MSLFDNRLYGYGVMLVIVGAVVSPAIATKPADGYPLSTYPMFAEKRGRTATLEQVLFKATGQPDVTLQPKYLRTGEVLQAKAKLARAIRAGKARTRALCEEIASEVASRGEPSGPGEVVIRTMTVDIILYFSDRAQAIQSEKVQARCPVKGNAP